MSPPDAKAICEPSGEMAGSAYEGAGATPPGRACCPAIVAAISNVAAIQAVVGTERENTARMGATP
jgi:hypothetical protein